MKYSILHTVLISFGKIQSGMENSDGLKQMTCLITGQLAAPTRREDDNRSCRLQYRYRIGGITMPTQAMIDFCKDAIEVQDACNPVAIVNALARHLNKHTEMGYRGWDDIVSDAPFRLWIDKLFDMAGRPGFVDYSKAHDACEQIVGTKNENSNI
jgi:hypothetical protein